MSYIRRIGLIGIAYVGIFFLIGVGIGAWRNWP